MEINNNWYTKNLLLVIKKKWDTFNSKVSVSTYKNNEIQILLDWITDKRNNILFDSNIDIFIKFNFSNINQDFFWLLLLIHWLNKYNPKTINLVLPYFPYTSKDLFIKKQNNSNINISTDNSLLRMLESSWISTIKTFDLGNLYIKNYSNIYIENVTKEDIFIEEINFLKKTTRKVSVIVLNQDDYIFFKNIVWKKDNINLIYIDEDISLKSKPEQINILNKLKIEWNKSTIYIFDKTLIRWNKIYSLTNLIAKNIDIRDLNICITHWVFAYWSYNKFNTLIERYSFIDIITTDSLIWYHKRITEENIEILKLPLFDDNN